MTSKSTRRALSRIARFAPLFMPLILGCAGTAKNPTSDPRPQAVEQAPGKVLMYEASSPDGAKVYLLGSIHVADSSFYPIDPTIERAFISSDALVVEFDTEKIEPMKMQALVIQYARAQDDRPLRQVVGDELYGRLDQFLSQRSVPIERFDGFKPWFVSMAVVLMRLSELGLRTDLGIDKHFIDRSHAMNKPVLDLETPEAQFAMLDGTSSDFQALMLRDSLEGEFQSGGNIEKATTAWKQGDAAAMEAFINDLPPGMEPLHEVLVIQRNLAMAEKIASMAQPGMSLFVVVGAGHVVGARGIAALLATKGYSVRQLDKSNQPSAELP